MIWGISSVSVAGLAAVALYATRSAPVPVRYAIPGVADPVVVEVLNGARASGLARVTTRRLRSRGIDVVYFGNAPDSIRQYTEVLVRAGDTAAARRVVEALGVGTIRDAPDPRLFLDVTVILGLDAASDTL